MVPQTDRPEFCAQKMEILCKEVHGNFAHRKWKIFQKPWKAFFYDLSLFHDFFFATVPKLQFRDGGILDGLYKRSFRFCLWCCL